MDDFKDRAYNKACKAERDAMFEELKKGIVLDGEATGESGNPAYPTSGPARILGVPGAVHIDEMDMKVADGVKQRKKLAEIMVDYEARD